MIKNCPMRHENGNCIPAGGFCTANKNICEALLNAYRMEKAQLSCEGTIISRQWLLECVDEGWIKFDTEEDANRFIHLVRDIAPGVRSVATDTNVGDTISRQAAIDALDCINGTEEVLRSLPPAQPEPKKGKWEQVSGQRYFTSASYFYRCSVCGENNPRNTNYCPNCGSYNRGGRK